MVFSLGGHLAPVCRVGVCSQPLTAFCVFHKFCRAPNTGLAVSFGFSRVILTSEAERPLFPATFLALGWFSSPTVRPSAPLYSLYLLEVLNCYPKTRIPIFPAIGSHGCSGLDLHLQIECTAQLEGWSENLHDTKSEFAEGSARAVPPPLFLLPCICHHLTTCSSVKSHMTEDIHHP